MTDRERYIEWLITEPSMEEAIARYRLLFKGMRSDVKDSLDYTHRIMMVIRDYIGPYNAAKSYVEYYGALEGFDWQRSVFEYEEENLNEDAERRKQDRQYHKKIRLAMLVIIVLNLLSIFIAIIRKLISP